VFKFISQTLRNQIINNLSHFSLSELSLKFSARVIEVFSIEVCRFSLFHSMHTSPSLSKSVQGHVLHAVEVDEGGRNDEDVEYLV